MADGERKSGNGFLKGKVKWIILAAVAVLVLFVVIRAMTAGKNRAVPVTMYSAKKGSIEEIVSVSGTVESARKKDYYATVTGKISGAPFQAGDRIKAGEVLFAYAEDELELSKQQAMLNLQQADGTYDDSVERENKALAKKSAAESGLPGVQARIDALQDQIDGLNNQINDKKLRMAQVGTQLQQTMKDINQNGHTDGLTDMDYAETQDADGNELYLTLQNEIAKNQLAQTNDPEIMEWNRQLTDLNEQMSKLTEEKSELKSDKSAGEGGELTEGSRSSREAQRELTRLTNEKTIRDIESVEGGIKADFAGVVTEAAASEGANAAAGTRLFTVASTEDVKVTMQISKSDMAKIAIGQAVDITVNGKSYEGEVSWISGTATRNSSNVPVVAAEVKVSNPDDGIILGVEASMKIHARRSDDVIVMPYEYVNTDTHGDYVYTVEDGILTRRDVLLGITTGTEAEISEGISEGEEIVAGDTSEYTEGMSVVAIPTAE